MKDRLINYALKLMAAWIIWVGAAGTLAGIFGKPLLLGICVPMVVIGIREVTRSYP